MFEEDFLNSFRDMKLPDYEIRVNEETGQFEIKFFGLWKDVTHWEIPSLKIINELFSRYYLMSLGLTRFEIECVRAEGIRRMKESFEILRTCGAFWSDFGTRRTFGVDWHTMAVEFAMEYFSEDQFRGTSDTKIAMDHGIEPIGTNAHELPMVAAALAGYYDRDKFIESQREVLRRWWDLYGSALSIALTDTYGSEFFFAEIVNQMDRYWNDWKGDRQDSGDPFKYGEMKIRQYRERGIDPSTKMIVFSDGLSAKLIAELHSRFEGRTLDTYGWGTLFSNNLGVPTLSLVCKVIAANGNGAVKLSDNMAKAVGSPSDIEKVKKIVGYENTFTEKCVV
jgi:nicotinate phosphoribosyltransferase